MAEISAKPRAGGRRRSSISAFFGLDNLFYGKPLKEVEEDVRKQVEESIEAEKSGKKKSAIRRFSAMLFAPPEEVLLSASPEPEEFVPEKTRSAEEQVASLTPERKAAFDAMRAKWPKERLPLFDDVMLLRFLRASPGPEKFNVENANTVAERYATWWMKAVGGSTITIRNVRQIIERKICVPLNTFDLEGNPVIYFKVSNIVPSEFSSSEFIQAIVYLCLCITEMEKASEDGITLIVDMGEWGMKNFTLTLSYSFADVLFNRCPCRIRRIFMINVPKVFSIPWSFTKNLLTEDMQEKVVFATQAEFKVAFPHRHSYPTKCGGLLDLDKCIEKFVKRRYEVEGLNYDDPFPVLL